MQKNLRVDVRGARSTDELLAAAGPQFNFAVEARPALFADGLGGVREGVGQMIVRTDTLQPLALVGDRYVPAQVQDFVAPLDRFLRDGLLIPVSASVFDFGLTRAIELQLPQPIVLPGPSGTEDVLLRRVIWRDNLDGSASAALIDSLLRRWCANGAAHVLGMLSQTFRHTLNRMAELRDLCLDGAVTAATERFARVETNARRLLAAPFTVGEMLTVARELYPDTEAGTATVYAGKARMAMVELFQRGAGNVGATAWDAANAVTEWSTHHRPVRGQDPKLSRLRAIWLGDAQAQRGIEAVARVAGVDLAN